MKIIGTGRNLFIINKQAELFDSLKIEDSMLSIFAAHKKIFNIKIETIHACLLCEELRNITIIIKEDNAYKISLIMENADTFHQFAEYMKAKCNQIEFSEQDKKITGYASAIVEKLLEGTVLTIIEKKVDTEIIFCPDCGVQCDPNIPYCMECGATIG